MCAPTATATHHDQVLQVTCIVWADIIGENKGAVQGIGGHVPDHQLGWTVHNGCRVHRVQPTHVQNPHAAKRIHCSSCTAIQPHSHTHTQVHRHSHTSTVIHAQPHSHSHSHSHTQPHTRRHTHTDTRARAHTHTQTHTHTQPHRASTTRNHTGYVLSRLGTQQHATHPLSLGCSEARCSYPQSCSRTPVNPRQLYPETRTKRHALHVPAGIRLQQRRTVCGIHCARRMAWP